MDLKERILKAGIENCMFLVPMKPIQRIMGIGFTSSNSPEFVVPCKISEERYKVEKDYKITLKSTYEAFGREHYYISDLNSLIRDGKIEFFIKENIVW